MKLKNVKQCINMRPSIMMCISPFPSAAPANENTGQYWCKSAKKRPFHMDENRTCHDCFEYCKVQEKKTSFKFLFCPFISC
jgi:hypothetical protein